ncbi:hypothetical protein EV292_1011074 [Sphingomonas sp. BK235]|jgi:hypothetical protein|nr:hypothetical protein EV292_1011074 [Sphingomonas sp. BK235]
MHWRSDRLLSRPGCGWVRFGSYTLGCCAVALAATLLR